MKYTTNLNLKKPEASDYYNIEDANSNADILDAKVGELQTNMGGCKFSVSDGNLIITYDDGEE